MVSARLAASHLQRHRMNLIEGVTGPFVNALNGIGRVRLRQAVDQPTVRVRPSLLEHDILLILNGKVGVVSLLQTLGGDADHSSVDIHELRHFQSTPFCERCRSPTPAPPRVLKQEGEHASTAGPQLVLVFPRKPLVRVASVMVSFKRAQGPADVNTRNQRPLVHRRVHLVHSRQTRQGQRGRCNDS
jgi:hypothetical protein